MPHDDEFGRADPEVVTAETHLDLGSVGPSTTGDVESGGGSPSRSSKQLPGVLAWCCAGYATRRATNARSGRTRFRAGDTELHRLTGSGGLTGGR